MPRPAKDSIDGLLTWMRARRPIRTGSLIITLFGDVVAVRGGSVWLGSVTRILEPLGVTYGQVRTAASRLRADDWLRPQIQGRRSFYRLTQTGQRRVDEATQRIYGASEATWTASWHALLFPDGLGQRHPTRRALGWLGWGNLGSQVFLHPSPDTRALRAVLADAPRTDSSPVAIEGEMVPAVVGLDADAPAQWSQLVATCWDLRETEADYQAFIQRFDSVASAVGRGDRLDPCAAMLLRLMLIHEYRRVLLRDPCLPSPLLDPSWPGGRARALTKDLYLALREGSEAWVSAAMEGPDGALPDASAAFYARFGA